VNKPHCLRSFKGHINEKNFVGLASNGDYVACGEWHYEKLVKKGLLWHKTGLVYNQSYDV